MVALINVVTYSFLAFSDLTCHFEIQECVFFGCTKPLDSKETKLENSNQDPSPSVGKKNWGRFTAMPSIGVYPYNYFGSVDILEILECLKLSGCLICYDRKIPNG